MRKYKIKDKKYLLIIENGKETTIDLDVLFPKPFKSYNYHENSSYIVSFKKWSVYNDKKYKTNAHFCCKSLNCEGIKRPFEEELTIIDELIVKDRKTRKILYKGKSYEEFKEACL